MNIFQRIVLVLGAIALVAAILTTPQVVIVQGSYVKPTAELAAQLMLQPMLTPGTAIVLSVAVIGATVLLFFALKGEIKKRPKKTKSGK
jgi:hypothetical protein